jgi:hypothetical protein
VRWLTKSLKIMAAYVATFLVTSLGADFLFLVFATAAAGSAHHKVSGAQVLFVGTDERRPPVGAVIRLCARTRHQPCRQTVCRHRHGAALMSDGYEAYNAISAANDLVHLGCWAHCRRYFIRAEEALPKQARTAG